MKWPGGRSHERLAYLVKGHVLEDVSVFVQPVALQPATEALELCGGPGNIAGTFTPGGQGGGGGRVYWRTVPDQDLADGRETKGHGEAHGDKLWSNGERYFPNGRGFPGVDGRRGRCDGGMVDV